MKIPISFALLVAFCSFAIAEEGRGQVQIWYTGSDIGLHGEALFLYSNGSYVYLSIKKEIPKSGVFSEEKKRRIDSEGNRRPYPNFIIETAKKAGPSKVMFYKTDLGNGMVRVVQNGKVVDGNKLNQDAWVNRLDSHLSGYARLDYPSASKFQELTDVSRYFLDYLRQGRP